MASPVFSFIYFPIVSPLVQFRLQYETRLQINWPPSSSAIRVLRSANIAMFQRLSQSCKISVYTQEHTLNWQELLKHQQEVILQLTCKMCCPCTICISSSIFTIFPVVMSSIFKLQYTDLRWVFTSCITDIFILLKVSWQRMWAGFFFLRQTAYKTGLSTGLYPQVGSTDSGLIMHSYYHLNYDWMEEGISTLMLFL